MIYRLLRVFSIALLTAFVFYVLFFAVKWWAFLTTSANITSEPKYFVVRPGASAIGLAKDLHDQGLVHNQKYFMWLVRFNRATRRLKAGMYEIKPGAYPFKLLQQFMHGDVVLHAFTIVNGWTYAQVKEALNNNPFLKHTLSEYGLPFIARKNPEGLFYPDTYLFAASSKDVAILKKAYLNMRTALNKAWKTRTKGLPYKNPYEALIVASMIEKESGLPEELNKVAAVILNRLKKGMVLQIDPTVIYGLGGRYKDKLTREDLKIDTPYNTYLHKGLPPTPIAMPGDKAIHAALHPANTKALYFVAKGNGSHVFSDTLEAHNKAVKKYRKTTSEKKWRIMIVHPMKLKWPAGICHK